MNHEVRLFRPSDEEGLRKVLQASLEFDHFPGYTAWDLEQELASILVAPDGVAVAFEDGVLCGLVGPRQDDLTVHPEYRRHGHGRRLLEAGLGLAASHGWEEIRLYVPPTDAAQAFARAVGLSYRSSLWQFHLQPGVAVPEPVWPAGVVARTFGDWLELGVFVALLNAAFAGHASPLEWTLQEIQRAHARPGFDPTAIVLVSPAERPDEPVGFVRTAIGLPEAGAAPVGEIRLVGVLPEWRGRGLGRELLRWGVAWLRSRGAGTIQLNVEAENELALGLYRRTGFEPAVEWPHWSRRV
jgi:mycothiol synthase